MPYGIELNRLAALWAEQPTSTCFAALAEALRKRGALDEAARVVAAGIAARPEYLPGHLVMARILADQQQWDAAQASIRAALQLDSTHPVALDAREEVTRRASGQFDLPTAAHLPVAAAPGEPLDTLIYSDEPEDEAAAPAGAETVLSESLAMLYRGQGHLVEAVDVLNALVVRDPENAPLAARRDVMRAELERIRPRPFRASESGGQPVQQWLSSMVAGQTPALPARSSFDAFFEAPTAAPQEDSDLAAFQSWLRELER